MLISNSGIDPVRLCVIGLVWFLVQLVVAALFWWLWSYAVSGVLGLPVLSFGQALALYLLIRLVISPPKIKFELS